MSDARKRGNRLVGEEREQAIQTVVELRDNSGMTWSQIAEEIDVNSAGTVRKLYKESGRNPHHLLDGKGGRTVDFQEGDWCDARCIGAHPDSPCDCKCGGVNHAGGGKKAQEILRGEEGSEEAIEHVEGIMAQNIESRKEREKEQEAKK